MSKASSSSDFSFSIASSFFCWGGTYYFIDSAKKFVYFSYLTLLADGAPRKWPNPKVNYLKLVVKFPISDYIKVLALLRVSPRGDYVSLYPLPILYFIWAFKSLFILSMYFLYRSLFFCISSAYLTNPKVLVCWN